MLYKIQDGILIETEETKIVEIDGLPRRVEKTAEELQGYKSLIISEKPIVSVYETIVETYVETYVENVENITLTYSVSKKPVEEIVAINTEFWNANYFLIPVSETEIYYAPHTTIMNGDVYNLLQDDLPMLLMGASAGQLTYLDMYIMPDFTQELTEEYIATLVVRISDTAKMTQIIGYMASLTYANRTVTSLE